MVNPLFNQLIMRGRTVVMVAVMILCGSLCTFSQAIAVETYSLDQPMQPMSFYSNYLYGVSESNQFVKMTSKGRQVWAYPQADDGVDSFTLYFDRAFLVTQAGDLICIDATYGHDIYKIKDLDIDTLLVRYPTVFFKNKNQQLGAFDFTDGQVIWQHESTPVDEFVALGRQAQIVAKRGRKLLQINGVTGETSALHTLKDSSLNLVHGWAGGAALAKGQKLYRLSVDDASVTELSVPYTPQSTFVQEKHYVYIDSVAKTWKKVNLLTDEYVAQGALDDTLSDVVFSRHYMGVIYSSNAVQVIQLNTGESVASYQDLPSNALDNITAFFKQGTRYSFMSNTNITQVLTR